MNGDFHNIRGTVKRFQKLAQRDFTAAITFGTDRLLELEESGHAIEPSQMELLRTSVFYMSAFGESENKRIEAEQVALTDALTGVANRRAFDRALLGRLDPIWRQTKKSTDSGEVIDADHTPDHGHVVLAILDIDNFKKFNDTFGHDIGDEVLRGVGSIYGDSFRKGDRFARFGGEEFALLLYFPHGEQVPDDQDIKEMIRSPLVDNLSDMVFMNEGEVFPVSFSIGLSHIHSGTINPANSIEEEASRFIKAADIDLYEDKKTKPSRIPALQRLIRETASLTDGLNRDNDM